MAVRTPLYWDGTGLAAMTTAMVADCLDETIRQYGLNPSVTLSYVASAGTLTGMDDTRLQSGQATTDVTNPDTEAETPEPTTITVNYDHISDATATVSTPADTANKAFPVFYHSATGSIQSMSLQDMLDTFVDPALARMVTNGYTSSVDHHDGMFFIGTANAAYVNQFAVDANPVYTNTIADTSQFLSSNIGTAGTTQDFPTTVQNYYLRQYKRDHAAGSTYIGPTTPMQINSSNDLQAFTEANFGSILQDAIRHATVNVVGSRLEYSIVTSLTGTGMGTGMADTKLNGSGNYQTRFVSSNDYRAQEFPDGTETTQNTYYLQAALV